jgi:hypothetical protein
MKRYIILLTTAVALPVLADQKKPDPAALLCDITACTKGEPEFCSEEAIASMPSLIMSNIHGYARLPKTLPGRSEAPRLYKTQGVQRFEADKVIFDFGVGATGGDQYYEAVFDRKEIASVVELRTDKITGTLVDGYDWIDGYHLRGEYILKCFSIK